MPTYLGDPEYINKFTEDELLESFRSGYMYTKEMILQHFDRRIEKGKNRLNKNSQSPMKLYYYNHYVQLMQEFREEISKRKLFDLPPWWCYAVDESSEGIQLCIMHMDYPIVEENNGQLDVHACDEDEVYVLIEKKYKYVTVEDFAKIYDVGEVTVRQWIRRGKIIGVKKEGNMWKIPEVSLVEKRGYKTRTYYYKTGYNGDDMQVKYKWLKNVNAIEIAQSNEDKKKFNVNIYNKKMEGKQEKIYNLSTHVMDVREKETFELMLLENNNIYSNAYTGIVEGTDWI